MAPKEIILSMIAVLTVSDEVMIGFVSAAFLALVTTVGILWKVILTVAKENREERERMRQWWQRLKDEELIERAKLLDRHEERISTLEHPKK